MTTVKAVRIPLKTLEILTEAAKQEWRTVINCDGSPWDPAKLRLKRAITKSVQITTRARSKEKK